VLVGHGGRVLQHPARRCCIAWKVPWEDQATLSENFCLESAELPFFSLEITHFKGFDVSADLAGELPY
jgi:hypothetical protein